MNTRSRALHRFLAFLCVALILACTLALFLEHEHTPGVDCEACAIIDLWRSLLLAIALLVSVGHIAVCVAVTVFQYSYIVLWNKSTPVGQRVKLSN